MRTLVATAVVVCLVAGACGGGGGGGEEVLLRVPPDLVPAQIESGGIKLYPKTDKKTVRAFANAGDRSLQADAKLWELRQGDRLVGALQITTVVAKLDLERKEDRNSILRQIMSGTVNELEVGDLPVWATSANDKIVYMWFGRDLFEVLQLKGTRLEPEKVLSDIVKHQQSTKAWDPLPAEAYDLS